MHPVVDQKAVDSVIKTYHYEVKLLTQEKVIFY